VSEVTPIGVVRSGYATPAETPVQSSLNPGVTGRVVLSPEYHDGLADLAGFSHLWLLTWLAPRTGDPIAMRQTPYLLGASDRQIGLFAMRGPRRPNPIGLHLVRLVEVERDGFRFAGVDMVDGTPLLDVKPYVAAFDVPPGHDLAPPASSGWFDEVDLSRPHTPESLRHAPGGERDHDPPLDGR